MKKTVLAVILAICWAVLLFAAGSLFQLVGSTDLTIDITNAEETVEKFAYYVKWTALSAALVTLLALICGVLGCLRKSKALCVLSALVYFLLAVSAIAFGAHAHVLAAELRDTAVLASAISFISSMIQIAIAAFVILLREICVYGMSVSSEKRTRAARTESGKEEKHED